MVTEYLEQIRADPGPRRDRLQTVGYGCTTCIGNSGPLDDEIADAIEDNGLVAVVGAVGQPQLRGPHHPNVRANYLASPPLVVAYALLGTMNEDITTAPLGTGKDGKPVYLKDIWPSQQGDRRGRAAEPDPRAVPQALRRGVQGHRRSGRRSRSTPAARPIDWNDGSTYVQNPPYFDGITMEPEAGRRHQGRAHARRAGRQHHDRPHQPGRRHPQGVARPANTCWSTRCSSRTSTPTARAAATTK